MFYTFPADLTLDETRDVVRRHNEALGVTAFIEADRGEYVIFNYVVSFPGSFPELTGDPVRDREIGIIRECRGITFDKATGKVVARKFHKFHNVGERPDTQQDSIDWTENFSILSKLDGSMITPYRNRQGKWEVHTKMGLTDVAAPVNEYIASWVSPNGSTYYDLFDHCESNNQTPIFEWTSRKQKIVVDYPEDALVLLAIRDNTTGEYVPY